MKLIDMKWKDLKIDGCPANDHTKCLFINKSGQLYAGEFLCGMGAHMGDPDDYFRSESSRYHITEVSYWIALEDIPYPEIRGTICNDEWIALALKE